MSVSLRGRLLAVVAYSLIPVVLLSSAGVVLLARSQRDELREAAINSARSMAAAVDTKLDSSVKALQTLAAFPALATGDLGSFHATVQRAAALQPDWDRLLVAGPDGTQLLDGAEPFGSTRLRGPVDRESFERLARTRAPVLGNVVIGPVQKRALFPVRVPVIIDGDLRYVLTAVAKPGTFDAVLSRQSLPPGSIATVFDGASTVASRSLNREQFVGRPLSASFLELLERADEGWSISRTLEGEDVYTAFSRSSATRWGAAVGIPVAVLDQPIRRAYMVLAAGVLLSGLLGFGAGASLSRRITVPIAKLGAAAGAISRGERPDFPDTLIPELKAVSTALAAAVDARRGAEAEREDALRKVEDALLLAQASSRQKDEFLAMLSHELRNPMAAIRSAAHVLQMKGDGGADEASGKALAIMGRQVEQLARLLDDLLDVQRVVSGKISLAPKIFDMGRRSGATSARCATPDALPATASPSRSSRYGSAPIRRASSRSSRTSS